MVDPRRLRDLGISLDKIREVVRASNMDVGGRTRRDVRVRVHGARARLSEEASPISRRSCSRSSGGTPVLLQDVARVELGPDKRRGIAELNGEGEVASGIVLQRFGDNALDVIDNVKKRIAETAPSACPRAWRSSRSTTAPSSSTRRSRP